MKSGPVCRRLRERVESLGITVTPFGSGGGQIRYVSSDGRAAASDDGSYGLGAVRGVDFCRARVPRDRRSHVAARSVAEKLGIPYVFAA